MVISNDNMAPWTEAEEDPINETPVNQDARENQVVSVLSLLITTGSSGF